ncbi:MAG: hypothetical protein ACO1PB_11755, partial [Ramlibacter sp.]
WNSGSGFGGNRPASLSGVAFTMIMKRMGFSWTRSRSRRHGGPCKHDEAAGPESTFPAAGTNPYR